jgi:hypothetical protein
VILRSLTMMLDGAHESMSTDAVHETMMTDHVDLQMQH